MERRRGSEWGVQVWEYLKSRNRRKKHLKQVKKITWKIKYGLIHTQERAFKFTYLKCILKTYSIKAYSIPDAWISMTLSTILSWFIFSRALLVQTGGLSSWRVKQCSLSWNPNKNVNLHYSGKLNIVLLKMLPCNSITIVKAFPWNTSGLNWTTIQVDRYNTVLNGNSRKNLDIESLFQSQFWH